MRNLQVGGLEIGNVLMGDMSFDSIEGSFSKFSPLGSMISYRMSIYVLLKALTL
jgi:hypothetical protein